MALYQWRPVIHYPTLSSIHSNLHPFCLCDSASGSNKCSCKWRLQINQWINQPASSLTRQWQAASQHHVQLALIISWWRHPHWIMSCSHVRPVKSDIWINPPTSTTPERTVSFVKLSPFPFWPSCLYLPPPSTLSSFHYSDLLFIFLCPLPPPAHLITAAPSVEIVPPNGFKEEVKNFTWLKVLGWCHSALLPHCVSSVSCSASG